jgi:plasmid stabilization system protein ParE
VSRFILAPEASADLLEIWNYYAVDLLNVQAADRIRDEIFEAMKRLSASPGLGHLRRDLAREPLRFWAVRKYLVIYRSERRPIEVVRILHAARDVRAILDPHGL